MSVVGYNSTYHPIPPVRIAHAILHLDSKLHAVSSSFGVSYDSFNNSYTQSLLPIPIICGVLGLIFLLIMQVSTCCCGCSSFFSNRNNKDGCRIKYITAYFALFILLALSADQIFLVGSSFLTEGVNSTNDAFDYIINLFNVLTYDGNQLNYEGNVILSNLTVASTGTCPQAGLIIPYFDSYFTYVDEYLSLVSPISGKVSNYQSLFNTWGEGYKNDSVYVIYAAVLLCLGFYLVGFFCKSKSGLLAGMGFSQVSMYFFLILGTVLMIVVVSFF
jgi:hypothetical protein